MREIYKRRNGVSMSEEDENLERKLNKFFQGLDAGLQSLREVREVYDEKMAFEFNSVNFFQPNENKLSEILAYFLNPLAKHGQKDKFLKIFAEHFELPKVRGLLDSPNRKISVHTEFHTNENRRIDIVIEIGIRDFFIGIENKIWAADQPNQLDDYTQFLSEISSNAEGDYVLFYLSPYGQTPSNTSVSKDNLEKLLRDGKVKIIGYDKDIISLFEEFETACKADNVRAFIKDFIQYLKQRFIGESIMGETEFITDFIVKDSNNIKVALEIMYSGLTIKEKLLKKIEHDIKNISDKHGLVFKMDITKLQRRREAIFSFRKDGWGKNTEILFAFENRNMKDFYYGIAHVNFKFLEKIYCKLNNDLKLGFDKPIKSNNQQEWTSNCTAFYTEFYQDWNDIKPWIDMVTLNEDGNSIFLSDLFDKVDKVLVCAEQTANDMGINL